MHSISSIGVARIALLTAAALLLGACATTPKTFSNQSPAGNFAGYETYNYADRLGTDDDPEIRSLLSQYLISEINGQMTRRGYRFAAEDADISFSLNLVTQEKIRSTGGGSFGGYYGRGFYHPYYPYYPYSPYYGGFGGYDYDNRIIQYTEGTLSVAIIDNATNNIVWEGVSIRRIDDEVRENLGAAVKTAVSEMFARYPYVAGSGVPQQMLDDNDAG